MFQGFYNLTSGALTQSRKLNVIGNNMANVSTPGYKKDDMVEVSFEEIMAYRGYNKPMVGSTQVGLVGRGVYADRNYTDYSNGALVATARSLDFGIEGQGFFVVQGAEGPLYTRNGSFSLDDGGFLTLQGVGQVLGTNNQPIYLGVDSISVDAGGNIYDDSTNAYLGTVQIVDFADYVNDLTKADNGTFVANAAAIPATGTIVNGALEGSNVEAVEQMTDMIAAQRAFQSSAQVLKMYDELMAKVVSKLGPV